MDTLPPRAELESAVLGRRADYDGLFVVAVTTTGVFCRPTCPSRKPRRENMEFFGTPEEAVRAGFRACLRCRPAESAEPEPAWAADLVRRVESADAPRLHADDLRALGLSPERVRRWFRRRHGMTFHAYARARRLSGALDDLRRGGIDDAVAASGFASHSGFRTAFARLFGGPPGRLRAAEAVVVTSFESPLGPLVAGATPRGVCLLEFSDRRMLETELRDLSRRLGAVVPGSNAHLDALEAQLPEYFSGRRSAFEVPLDLVGTPFQKTVWEALLRIPFGATRSYGSLAREVGRPGASRAVGRANGQNRVAIVVPCHRVVHEDGTLGGYGGGLRRKQHLLDLERRVAGGAA
jgi:AraC family transcriptional regulator of adaptative response/methylated-DNA-[protein]-cysteine methyltransferase